MTHLCAGRATAARRNHGTNHHRPKHVGRPSVVEREELKAGTSTAPVRFRSGNAVCVTAPAGPSTILLSTKSYPAKRRAAYAVHVGLDITEPESAPRPHWPESEALQRCVSGQPHLHRHHRMFGWPICPGESTLFMNWTGYTRDDVVGRSTAELNLWDRPEKTAKHSGADTARDGFVCTRECEQSVPRRQTIHDFAVIGNHPTQRSVPHAVAWVGISRSGKQAEAELRASEARLRESEKRFSVAFSSQPGDHRHPPCLRRKIRSCERRPGELAGMLAKRNPGAKAARTWACGKMSLIALQAWEELSVVGSIRQKECRWRNRRGESFTILLSAETITLGDAPHVLLLALDITQRKQAEVEILKITGTRKGAQPAQEQFCVHGFP